MKKRSITERVEAQEKRLQAMLDKLAQEKQVLKDLQQKKSSEMRKYRNHKLIVLASTICSLFGFSYFEDAEIDKLVEFIKECKDKGLVEIEKCSDEVQEDRTFKEKHQEKTEEKAIEAVPRCEEVGKSDDDELFGGMFIF